MKVEEGIGLDTVLDDCAPSLEVMCGAVGARVSVVDVVIYDRCDELSPLPARVVALGVGLSEPGDVAAALRDLGLRGGRCLVVRATGPVAAQVAEAVSDCGVVLLGLRAGTSWLRLVELLRAVLTSAGPASEAEVSLGSPDGELFTTANAIAALLDAPVTIEDRQSRVLAFSGRQREADHSRIDTILGRRVPEPYRQVLEQRGVFRRVYREEGPVFVEPVQLTADEVGLPRAVVAVRAGGEILGSIWVAVPGPLNAERSHALIEASRVVALQLLRLRAGVDVERRVRAALVSTALGGTEGAASAARSLGLGKETVVVLAAAPVDAAGPRSGGAYAGRLAGLQQLGDALAVHLGAVHPRAAVAVVGDAVYGLLPVSDPGAAGERIAARIAAGFLDRTGDLARMVIGVGSPADDLRGLARSRSGADRALRVLSTAGRGRRVAGISTLWAEASLLELGDLLTDRGELPRGAVARLAEHDRDHQTQLLPTLRAWLDAFGNVIAAADRLYVHPNTFRYRLHRAAEVGKLDLDDTDDRFAAMLELRLTPSG